MKRESRDCRDCREGRESRKSGNTANRSLRSRLRHGLFMQQSHYANSSRLALEIWFFFFCQFLFRFFFAICCKFRTGGHFAPQPLSFTSLVKVECHSAYSGREWCPSGGTVGGLRAKVTNTQRLLFGIDFRHLSGITAGPRPLNPHLNPPTHTHARAEHFSAHCVEMEIWMENKLLWQKQFSFWKKMKRNERWEPNVFRTHSPSVRILPHCSVVGKIFSFPFPIFSSAGRCVVGIVTNA